MFGTFMHNIVMNALLPDGIWPFWNREGHSEKLNKNLGQKKLISESDKKVRNLYLMSRTPWISRFQNSFKIV